MRHNMRAEARKTAKGLGVRIDHSKQNRLTKEHFAAGDVSNRIPIQLSDGKTTIFVKQGKDIESTKKFWENRINKLNLPYYGK